MGAPLILASTSRYRAELLRRLGVEFTIVAPGVDETAARDEPAEQLAERLAREKALAVARIHPDALVLGSDQTALAAGRLLGKPGSLERAREQLGWQSGRSVTFCTAVALASGARVETRRVDTVVTFRTLGAAEIERYLLAEMPFDCAGSARIEGLGIALIERFESSDPTALIGLPLIATCGLLRRAGVELP